VKLGLTGPEGHEDKEERTVPSLFSHTPSPATLYVNQESRTEALHHYIVLLTSDAWQKHTVYFNTEVDTLVLDGKTIDAIDSWHAYAIMERGYAFRKQIKSLHYELSPDAMKLGRFILQIQILSGHMMDLSRPLDRLPECITWSCFPKLETLKFTIDFPQTDDGFEDELFAVWIDDAW